LGAHGLGAIVVKVRAHRENLWDLTAEEAASLGPFLQRITQALQSVTGAERIYISSWVDQPPHHVHFVLQPRYPGKEELGLRGLELQIYRALQPKPPAAAIAAISEKLQAHFQAVSASPTSAD
jgi:diadenosine tetraphosphate (Ap4A) HIT family hydrolase